LYRNTHVAFVFVWHNSQRHLLCLEVCVNSGCVDRFQFLTVSRVAHGFIEFLYIESTTMGFRFRVAVHPERATTQQLPFLFPLYRFFRCAAAHPERAKPGNCIYLFPLYRFFGAQKGMGTVDHALQRQIITRSEIDMVQVKVRTVQLHNGIFAGCPAPD
jgi:hypothetical protein